MRRVLSGLLALLLSPAVGGATERRLELQGEIDPAPGRAFVLLEGATFPFTDSAMTDSRGRFRFRKLAPGPYTITVFLPGVGETRRTVEVSPSLADSKGRVTVTIPFAPAESSAAEVLKRGTTVSMRELSIPERARNEYNEARKKLGRHDVAGAVGHLERAVELAPQFADAWNHLGTIAYQSGRYQDAENYFRKALEQDPGSFAPAVNLGGVLVNMGKYAEALKYNRYAVGERPEDALANSQLGANYLFLGDEEQALKYLDIARRLDPAHFSHPQLLLADIYLRRANTRAAIRELEDFLARHPDAPDAGRVRQKLERLKKP